VDVYELMGRVSTNGGQFFAGHAASNIVGEGNLTTLLEANGLPLSDPIVSQYPGDQKLDRSYVDYLYTGSKSAFSLGFEHLATRDFYGDSREDFLRAGAKFNCPLNFVCVISHDEFLSAPLSARESIRYQFVDGYVGRGDYLPYYRIKLDSVMISREWTGWNFLAGYQSNNVKHPPENLELSPNAPPNFKERDFVVQLSGNFYDIDAVGIRYTQNKSKTLYDDDVRPRGNIPHQAQTELVEFWVEEGFGHGIFFNGVLKDVDQKYLFPLQLNDLDYPTRSRFINLDLTVRYEILSGLNVNAKVLNLFGNSKEFIDGAPANLGSKGSVSVDSLSTERIFALSVQTDF
jgi:hypothetical protein